jgi:NAD kinase
VSLAPRVVTVSRRSELDELMARHGTRAAAAYFLRQRGRDLDEVQARHDALTAAMTEVGAAIPADWRRGHVDRDDLPRFLFAPEDIVVAVGQDGLVANVAKYVDGQPVIGVDPEPARNPGVLVRHDPGSVAALLRGRLEVERRTMVVAELDDGQELAGLNEVYCGHPTHQSSRYVLSTADGQRERQSSSGIVVGTGTGATGWCASIARSLVDAPPLPDADDEELCWFVREAWPSPATGVSVTAGLMWRDEWLEVVSESERLVVFADGLEGDRLELAWGQRVRIGVAPRSLALVVGAQTVRPRR